VRTWFVDWKLRGFTGTLALALAAAAYPQTPDAPRESVSITTVTVIDVVTGTKRIGVTVLIQGDRITAMGPKVEIPPGTRRLSGRGKFLIPGLWDMHSHHQGTGAECLDLFVTKGVVGTRDMGGDANFILPLRERVNSGSLFGPEIVAAGPIVDDVPASFPYRLRVRNAQEAMKAVHDLKRLGVDFIKVHDHTPRDVFFEIAAEHLSNYNVFGECMTGEEYTPAGCGRLFSKLAAKGVWQTPTMAFFQTIPDVFSGMPLAHSEYASDSLLELTRKNVEASHVPAKTLDKYRLAGQISLRAIHDLQVWNGLPKPGSLLWKPFRQLLSIHREGRNPAPAHRIRRESGCLSIPHTFLGAKPHRVPSTSGNGPIWYWWTPIPQSTSAISRGSPV
jgi:hypothetical protein